MSVLKIAGDAEHGMYFFVDGTWDGGDQRTFWVTRSNGKLCVVGFEEDGFALDNKTLEAIQVAESGGLLALDFSDAVDRVVNG